MLINNTDLPNAVIDEIVAENMAAVGLDASLLKKYPDQLTPSEARRVSIARAITYDKTRPKSFFGVPHVIIYDEPTAGLDEKSSKWLVHSLRIPIRRISSHHHRPAGSNPRSSKCRKSAPRPSS